MTWAMSGLLEYSQLVLSPEKLGREGTCDGAELGEAAGDSGNGQSLILKTIG
jgi:hypothetical protein